MDRNVLAGIFIVVVGVILLYFIASQIISFLLTYWPIPLLVLIVVLVLAIRNLKGIK